LAATLIEPERCGHIVDSLIDQELQEVIHTGGLRIARSSDLIADPHDIARVRTATFQYDLALAAAARHYVSLVDVTERRGDSSDDLGVEVVLDVGQRAL